MTQIVGSLLLTMEANSGPMVAGLNRAAAHVRGTTSRMRTDLEHTSGAVSRMNRSFNAGISGRGLMIAARSLDTAASRANVLRTSLLTLTGVFGGFSAVLAVNSVMALADGYTNLKNQLRTVIDNSQLLTGVENELFKAAQRSRSGFRETATLFTRLVRSTRGLSLSYKELIGLTETIQKGFVVGGSTPQEAASFAIQFSQALASNRLGGEELRAVLETPLGGLLAKGMNVSIGKFREMGKEGELTADRLIEALKKVAPEIEAAFSRTSITISQSFTAIDNALTKYIGSQDSALGASRMFANGMVALANNIDMVVEAAAFLGVALGARYIAGAISPAIQGTILASGAMATLRASQVALAQEQLRSAQAAQLDTAAKARNAAMAYNNARANAALGASIATTGRAAGIAAANHAAASAAVVAAQSRVTAAIAQTGTAAVAAAGAMRVLNGVVGFLGGPVGALLTVAAVGFYWLSTRTTEAERAATAHAEAMDELRGKILDASSASQEQRDELRRNIEAQILAAEAAVKNAKAQLLLAQASAATQDLGAFVTVDPETAAGMASPTGAGGADYDQRTQAIAELETKIRDLAAALGMLDAVESKSKESTNASSDARADAAAKADKYAKALQELRFQTEQAGRSERDQFIYDELNRQGLDLDSERGRVLAAYAAVLFDVRKAQEAKNAYDKQAIEITRDLIDAETERAKKLKDMEFMTGVQKGLERIMDDAGNYAESAEKIITGLYSGLENALVTFATTGKLSFRDMINGMIADVARLASKMAMSGLFNLLGLGSLFSFDPFGGAGIYHAGGMAGEPKQSRMVPAAAFHNAPRFHSGFKPDEFAAILQRGEMVLSRSDTDRTMSTLSGLSKSSGMTVNYAPVINGGSGMDRKEIAAILRIHAKELTANLPELLLDHKARARI